jgi:hypothetical protein
MDETEGPTLPFSSCLHWAGTPVYECGGICNSRWKLLCKFWAFGDLAHAYFILLLRTIPSVKDK